jgi:hypothetical protein
MVLLVAAAATAPCLELRGGVQAGAGGSLLYGTWVDGVRDELVGLGAGTVTDQEFYSWRLGGWVEFPLANHFSIRMEPGLGLVGGALLASDGYDLLTGAWALELALPVLATARIALPVGEIVLVAGLLTAVALPVMRTWNDGTVWYDDKLTIVLASFGVTGGLGYTLPVGPGAVTFDLRVLAGLLSVALPSIDGMLNAMSVELTAGWEFRS